MPHLLHTKNTKNNSSNLFQIISDQKILFQNNGRIIGSNHKVFIQMSKEDLKGESNPSNVSDKGENKESNWMLLADLAG